VTHATFRVQVDPGKCQGHNRCYRVSPELFELDDLGMSSAAGAGLVPAALVGAARLAVANCPEYAISLAEAGDGEAGDGEAGDGEAGDGQP
jgi:ferredoxin